MPGRPTPPTKRSRSQTYWILRQDQIECLASSRRHSILDRLCADGASSVRKFSRAVGIRPSAAYHHLKLLIAVGLVEEAGARSAGRTSEKLYRAVAPRMRMAAAVGEPALAEPVSRVVSALCRQMDRDFAAGFEQPGARASGSLRNLGFFRIVGAPDAATLREVNARLAEISELLWKQPQRGKTLISFGWTLAPLGEPDRDT